MCLTLTHYFTCLSFALCFLFCFFTVPLFFSVYPSLYTFVFSVCLLYQFCFFLSVSLAPFVSFFYPPFPCLHLSFSLCLCFSISVFSQLPFLSFTLCVSLYLSPLFLNLSVSLFITLLLLLSFSSVFLFSSAFILCVLLLFSLSSCLCFFLCWPSVFLCQCLLSLSLSHPLLLFFLYCFIRFVISLFLCVSFCLSTSFFLSYSPLSLSRLWCFIVYKLHNNYTVIL